MLAEKDRIQTRKQLHEWLEIEKKQYHSGGLTYLFQITERDILYRHQKLLRKTEYYTNTHNRIMAVIYKCLLNKVQNKHSLLIPLNCCGKGLKIMHLGPVLMNARVTVGEYCSIHINSGLVADGIDNGVPTLGRGVIVGFGAVVLGDTTIANNVAIGANAVVNKDIFEEDVAVAGVPAKIISRNGRTKWNKKNTKSIGDENNED